MFPPLPFAWGVICMLLPTHARFCTIMIQTELLLRQRHGLIRKQLETAGRVLASELAVTFDVSEDTIRRDLRMMAAAGQCERVYGGALAIEPKATTLSERMRVAPERKAALARCAVAFVKDGMTVFFDAGSTNLAIARALPDDVRATIATNTPVIASALMEKPGVELILIGGKFDRQAGAAIGAKAQRDAEMLRPDLCILGACGIDATEGVTAVGFEDAEFKRVVVMRSKAVLAAVTNAKLGLRAPHAVLPVAGCTHLLLEHDAPLHSIEALRALCADVIVTPQTP